MGAIKSSTRSQRPYATLEPRVTNVSQAAVRKKWKPLPETSHYRLSQIFESVQKEGLVGLGKKNKKKNDVSEVRLEGEQVVKDAAERLTRRLPKMPFPPRIDERDFDFEGTLQRVHNLENQLTSNFHSVGLLKAQIKKEEQMLEKDMKELKVLQQGARESGAMRKEQAQKLHPLARDLPDGDEDENAANYQANCSKPTVSLDIDLHVDSEAQKLGQQLRSHLESMQNNTAGTRELVEALGQLQAKLDVFTATALTSTLYEMLYGLER